MEWSAQGQDKLTVARRLHGNAIDFYAHGDVVKAERYLAEALKHRRSVLPSSHPIIIATLELLVLYSAQTHQQTPRDTIQLLTTLLEAKRERFGQCHIETEETMTKLSALYASVGDKVQSDQLNGEIWRIRCMTSAERQAMDFESTLSVLKNPNPRRKPPSLVGEGSTPEEMLMADVQKVHVRTSKFVDSDEWLERLKTLRSMRPEMREEQKKQWEKEDREKRLGMLFDDPMIAGNTSFAAPGVLGSNTMAPSIQVDPPTAADDYDRYDE